MASGLKRLPRWVERQAGIRVGGCSCATRRLHDDASAIARVSGYRVAGGDDWGPWYSQPVADSPSLDTTLVAVGPYAVVYDEKFLDPWWNCIRASETPGEWESISYLLEAPATGKDRVAAMRARIDAYAIPPGPALLAMQDQSWKTFEGIRAQLWEGLQTADGRKALATKIGIPVETVEKNAASIIDTLSTYGIELEPLFKALFKEFGQPILDGIKSGIESITGIALSGAEAASGAVKGFSDSIPLLGSFASFFISMYSAESAASDDNDIRTCAGWTQRIKTTYEKAGKLGLPSPWHREIFGTDEELKCQADDPKASAAASPHLANLYEAAMAWLIEFNDLPNIPYRASVAKWWLTALTYMSDPAVFAAFNALGRDKWGVGLASDEQVMLVAIPIAISYGFTDIDAFAAELWNRSAGWSGMGTTPVDLHHPRAGQPYLYMAEVRQNKIECPSFLSAGHCVETSEYRTICTANIKNAFFAQFAVLARDAIALAEERKVAAKKETPLIGFIVTLAPPAASSPQKKKTSLAPVVVGGVGSGVAFLARAPMLVVALPATIGVGLYLWVRKVKKSAAPPLPPVDRPRFYGFTTSDTAKTRIGDKIAKFM